MININKLLLPLFLRKKGKRMQKRTRIITSLLLLTLFVAYQVNITMFAHVHYVNGVMLVHSHPSADSQHTHTESQSLTLAQASHWSGLEAVSATVSEIVFSVSPIRSCARPDAPLHDCQTQVITLRAPPEF